jgi:uncharacterized membrane protein YdbT with pleckstrin-like domain
MTITPDRKLFSRMVLDGLTICAFLGFMALVIWTAIHVAGVPQDIEKANQIIPLLAGGAVVLFWIIYLPITSLWIKNLSYSIEDDRVTIHKGILTKVQQNIPYRAITDFQLHRSLWDRAMGIGSIKIQTAGQHAGAQQFEGVLAGLLDYTNLHQQLRAKLNRLHPMSDSATGVTSQIGRPDDGEVRYQVLEEVRAIRKLLESRK